MWRSACWRAKGCFLVWGWGEQDWCDSACKWGIRPVSALLDSVPSGGTRHGGNVWPECPGIGPAPAPLPLYLTLPYKLHPCRTPCRTQATNSSTASQARYSGVLDAVASILRREGLGAFFKVRGG